ncbi:MAG: SUMF1/EgtB/PvdO family nonheme iron enzyme, partial [Bacteroidetes bacterium]|nr:SUMF1/EgtB/PvdO family nonheme iron enzyme [Bacteroidota bacterium]
EYDKIKDYYSYSRLMSIIKSIDTQHTLLIVDSCYSGAFLVRQARSDLERWEKDPSRWILASGRNEVVSDGSSGQNSPFADQLVDVLKRYSKEGLNVMDLVNKVTTAVSSNARQTPIGCPLRDVGDKGGQFVFHPKHNESRDWKEALTLNTVEGYDEFVRIYPESPFVEEAYWKMTLLFNVKRAYRDYREQFPNGRYQEEALKKLAYLDEKEQYESSIKKGEAALTIFLENFPNGFFAEEARDEIARIISTEDEPKIWAKATRRGTVDAYLDYLRKYPNGKNAGKAVSRIEELKSQTPVTVKPEKKDDFLTKKNQETQPSNIAGIGINELVTDEEAIVKRNPGKVYKYLWMSLAVIVIILITIIWILNRPLLPEEKEMVIVPGGSFQMGDIYGEGFPNEGPIHLVKLDSFYLSPTEVSVTEFAAFIEETNYKTDADRKGGSDVWSGRTWKKQSKVNWRYDVQGKKRKLEHYNHPVVHVSWNDAVNYCNWLSEKHNLEPVYEISGKEVNVNWEANGFRLPTEAEWEYSARSGGKNIRFGNGKDIADPLELVFDGSEDFKKPYSVEGFFYENTFPVDSVEGSRNPLGIYHMSGNVWEWCWDKYTDYTPEEAINPHGADTSVLRVARGGGWRNFPVALRVFRRFKTTPDNHNVSIGFRVARNR